MEDSEKKSTWDELAQELGASAPQENERPIIAADSQDTPRPPKREAAPPPPRPKVTSKDWDILAAGLGIEVTPEPEPESTPPPPPRPAPVRAVESRPPREREDVGERPEAGRREESSQEGGRREGGRGEGRPQRGQRGRGRGSRDRGEGGERGGNRGGERSGERGGGRGERPQRDSRGRRGDRDRRPPRERRPESAREEHAREERAREQRDELVREEHSQEDRIQHFEERAPEMEAESPTPREPEQSFGGAAVSLWHKIFGSPEQQAHKITESERDAELEASREDIEFGRAREARSTRRGNEWNVEEAAGEFTAEHVEMGETWVEGSEESARGGADVDAPATGGDDDQREGRGRRRRRGGRGRRGRGERSGESSGGESRSERGERSERSERSERKPRERGDGRSSGRGRRGGRSSERRDDDPWRGDVRVDDAEEDFLDDVMADDDDALADQPAREMDLDDDDAGNEEGGQGAAVGSRNIPSWEEAIGMLVEVNMQGRSERRPSSGPRGTRGNSQSRGGRGGRRRGGRSRGSERGGSDRGGERGGDRGNNGAPSSGDS